MNDERLLFRAWNGGKMVHFGEGSITYASADEDTMRVGLFFPLVEDKHSMTGFGVMQCAESKDKTDTLIYESDILRVGPGWIVTVTWMHGTWLLINDKQQCHASLSSYKSSDIEIIGNIHANPELIGGAI